VTHTNTRLDRQTLREQLARLLMEQSLLTTEIDQWQRLDAGSMDYLEQIQRAVLDKTQVKHEIDTTIVLLNAHA
jgi:hypothetical protein